MRIFSFSIYVAFVFFLLLFSSAYAQTQAIDILPEEDLFLPSDNEDFSNTLVPIYRATPTVINDLVHTKIDITPIFETQRVNGKVWITLKPHFLPTDSLTLDAKFMDIHSVKIKQDSTFVSLSYNYDNTKLYVKLPRLFTRDESYTIYITYTAKPNEKPIKGSAAITSDKGFYFINPLGKEKDKPTQIWTQGETESSSVWFPTIEQLTQKTTQELLVTVPQQYVTLSNGILTAQTNKGNLRTDYWVMEKPHSPYLFFVGVGDYKVVRDYYKGMEVSYYVEPAYEHLARRIFGMTPDMIAFFEQLLGFPYPWSKYAQIVGRDYVSGAMENTTATLHMESAYQNERELKDGNQWEYVIAHELFHHWFGDLVTAESWSNLSLNESFADYSEYLWYEYRYGKEMAESHRFENMRGYYYSKDKHNKDLIRFYYEDKEDMFDIVSYTKGGSILHMLRSYLGDEIFFASLQLYLKNNQYKSAEAHQLRLAFEEISGQDLNWFFNQWYYSSGHPKLDIKYESNDARQEVQVHINQLNDKVFNLPCKVAIHYNEGIVVTEQHFLKRKKETLHIDYDEQGNKPLWISVDADNSWIVEKKDYMPKAQLVYQLQHGGYIDCNESIDALSDFIYQDKDVKTVFFQKLRNSHFRTKLDILDMLAVKETDSLSNRDWKVLAAIADNKEWKEHTLVQAAAIDLLATRKNAKRYKKLFLRHIQDSSYAVAGASLAGLYSVDTTLSFELLPELKQGAKGKLREQIFYMVCEKSSSDNINFVIEEYIKSPFHIQAYFSLCMMDFLYEPSISLLDKKRITDGLYHFYTNIPEQYDFLKAGIDGLITQNKADAPSPNLEEDILAYFRMKFNL